MSLDPETYFADVAVVLHRGQRAFGSGRLIAPGIVLTSGHVVDCPSRENPARDDWNVRLIRERATDGIWHDAPYEAKLVWRHQGNLDLALLKITDAAPSPSIDLVFASYHLIDPLDQTDAAGFPEARRVDDIAREYSLRGVLRIADQDGPFTWTVALPDAPVRRNGWSGMSGAVVTRADEDGRLHLFGVVQEVPGNFSAGQLAVTRLAAAFTDSTFTTLLSASMTRIPQVVSWSSSSATRWLAQITGTLDSRDPSNYYLRPSLQSALEEFFKDRGGDRGIWRLQGDGGVGKTSFLANLVTSFNYIHYFAEPGIADPFAPTRSLIAQLVLRYRPSKGEYVASLPDGAAVLDVYDRILHDIARGLAEGERIVIVVDGLDEMEPITLQAGVRRMAVLPRRVPSKVFFILAQRRVDRPIPAEPRPVVFDLRTDSASNLVELRCFLEQIATQSWLSAPLEAAGRTVASFVDELEARAAGSWIYIRYLVEDLRSKRRSVAELEQLPTGLPAYYHDFFDRWRGNERWHGLVKPALATFAAARESLTLDSIAEFSGLPSRRGELLALLRDSFGPFIRARGEPLRYFPVHSTVTEFLSGVYPEMPETPLVDDLRAATLDAHRNIARALQNHRDPEATAYAERNLLTHMGRGGMTLELSATLRNPMWYERQCSRSESPIDVRAYDLDIEEGRRLVAADNTRPYSSLAIWCAFWRATGNSWSAHLEPWAIAALVRGEYLDGQAALTHARAAPSDRARTRWIVALARVLRGDWVQELLALAGRIADQQKRGQAVAAIAKRPEAPDYIDRLLRTAKLMKPYAARPMVRSILPAVRDAQLQQILDFVADWPAERDSLSRARAMAYIVGEFARRKQFGFACRSLRALKPGVERAFASAALLEQPWEASIQHRKLRSMHQAIRSAERVIADWIELREALYAFLRAAGSIDGQLGRAVKARLLWTIRQIDHRQGWIKAISVSPALPSKTARSLACWIEAKLREPESRWLVTGGWEDTFYECILWLTKTWVGVGDFDRAVNALFLAGRAEKIADATEAVIICDTVPEQDSSRVGNVILSRLQAVDSSAALQISGALYCQPNRQLTRADLEPITVVPQIGDAQEASLARSKLAIACVTYAPVEALDAVSAEALSLSESLGNSLVLRELASRLLARGRFDAAADVILRIESPEVRGRALLALLRLASTMAHDADIALGLLKKDQSALAAIISDLVWEEVAEARESPRIRDLLESTIQQLLPSLLFNAVDLVSFPEGRSSPAYDQLTALLIARMVTMGQETNALQLLTDMKTVAPLLPHWRSLPVSLKEGIITRVEGGIDVLDKAHLALYRLQKGDSDGIDLVFAAAEEGRVRSNEVMHFLSRLPLSDHRRFIGYLVRHEVERAPLINFLTFRWLLPHLDEQHIQSVLARSRQFDDDYRRDELVVALLPRIADVSGFESAWTVAKQYVGRGDWRAQASLTLFSRAQGNRRTEAMKEILAAIERGEETEVPFWRSLDELAECLDGSELELILSRLIAQMGNGRSMCLRPYAERSTTIPSKQAIAIWRRIIPELENLPRNALFAAVGELAPLIGKLDGHRTLIEVQRSIVDAREWWP